MIPVFPSTDLTFLKLNSHTLSVCCQSIFQSSALFILVAVLGTVLLSGCAVQNNLAWRSLVNRGIAYGFRPIIFNVPPFLLSGLIRGWSGQAEEMVVYLEGDGRAVVYGRVTQNPTSVKPMAFELACSDPAPAVLYLARVGQYQPTQNGKNYQLYWSNKRFAEEVVNSANLALDEAKQRLGVRRIHLVGYSGGGGLAVLLAERRSDIYSLATVAGLLDTQWWVREKNFQPLVGSLNPADCVSTLLTLRQVHFYGTEDVIIPAIMSAHFQRLATFTNFRRVGVATNHWRGWSELWPDLLTRYLLPLRGLSKAPFIQPEPENDLKSPQIFQ